LVVSARPCLGDLENTVELALPCLEELYLPTRLMLSTGLYYPGPTVEFRTKGLNLGVYEILMFVKLRCLELM